MFRRYCNLAVAREMGPLLKHELGLAMQKRHVQLSVWLVDLASGTHSERTLLLEERTLPTTRLGWARLG